MFRSSPFLSSVILLVTLLVGISTSAQQSSFAIWKGRSMVGHVLVDRRTDGALTRYEMTSRASVVLLWAQEVRTTVVSEYLGDRLRNCHSSVRVNDVLRDSSNLCMRNPKPIGYLHEGRSAHQLCTNAWTTARMYFEEPVGQRQIFVESVLSDRPLERTGPGAYTLVLPDGKVNRYVYRQGVLQEIHVDRNFFELVFRRV